MLSDVLLLRFQGSEQQPTQPPQIHAIIWATARAWLSPPRHLLAGSAVVWASITSVTVTAQLAAAQLAFLGDCQVLGRTLLPAAVLSEMVAAACRTLFLGDVLDDGRLLLTDAVLGPPLDPRTAAAAPCRVGCQVNRAAGSAEVISSGAHTTGGARHLSARVVAAGRATAQSAAATFIPQVSLRVRMQILNAAAATFTASPAVLATLTVPACQLESTGFYTHPAAAEAAQSLSAAVLAVQIEAGMKELGQPAQWDVCLPQLQHSEQQHAGSMHASCIKPSRTLAWMSVLKVLPHLAVECYGLMHARYFSLLTTEIGNSHASCCSAPPYHTCSWTMMPTKGCCALCAVLAAFDDRILFDTVERRFASLAHGRPASEAVRRANNRRRH